METHDLTVIGRDANFRFETESDDAATREAILHRAPRPVLLVPEDSDGPLNRQVVVAYDGSRAAKRAIASFAASGLARSRSIHVATVDDNGESAWEMASAGVKAFADLGVAAVPRNIVSALSNVEALFGFAQRDRRRADRDGGVRAQPARAAVSRLGHPRPGRTHDHAALPAALTSTKRRWKGSPPPPRT